MFDIKNLSDEPPILQVTAKDMQSVDELNEYINTINFDTSRSLSNTLNNKLAFDGANCRYFVNQPGNPSKFLTDLRQPGVVFNILKMLMDMDTVARWPMEARALYSYCQVNPSLVVDLPGFQIPWHVDNRKVVMQGIINLKDNEFGTEFRRVNDDNSELSLTASSRKGQGVFWLNTENSWHHLPVITERRHVLMCNLILRLGP